MQSNILINAYFIMTGLLQFGTGFFVGLVLFRLKDVESHIKEIREAIGKK